MKLIHSKIIALFFIFTLLLNGCAIHDGQITGNAALSGNNYRYVGKVAATNKCVYVFFWGGNEKKAQISELKENLQKRYPLRNGLAWANVSVEMKTGFYILFDVRKAVLTADIVDFWPDTNTAFAAYNGYYYNDTTFIPVPNNLRNFTTANQDSLTQKLMFMNARQQNIDPKKIEFFAQNDIHIYSEVLIFMDDKPFFGIVLWPDVYGAEIGYLNEYGQYKTTKKDFMTIFKYRTP